MNKLGLLLAFGLLGSSLYGQSLTFDAANSSAAFAIKNAGFTVDGKLKQVAATATFDGAGQPVTLEATAETASLDTENKTRDGHLKGDDYFDVAKYPTIRFVATRFEGSEGAMIAIGQLTIKKVTKEVRLPVKIISANGRVTLSTEFKLNRRDYGVGGSSWIMSDEATLKISLAFEPAK
jgi:polyisoprenoid-binding protein YceI